MMRKPFHDLQKVLLLRGGLLHEFILHVNHPTSFRKQFAFRTVLPQLSKNQSITYQDSFEFDQVLLHLSKNHKLKKLELFGFSGFSWLNMPISIFSLHHLTDLNLYCFNLDHQPIFNGFDSLRRLSLIDVGISTKTLLHLLSNCSSLESLRLSLGTSHLGGEDCNVIELFKCLPMMEHLTIFGDVFKWLVLDSVPQELPTLLYNLKSLSFRDLVFSSYGYGLAFLLVLIKCSPNLEKIKIYGLRTCYEKNPVVWKDYSDVCLENLNELEIERFSNAKLEMEFVKFILARSPRMRNLSICCECGLNQELEVSKTLLEAPRASTVVITIS